MQTDQQPVQYVPAAPPPIVPSPAAPRDNVAQPEVAAAAAPVAGAIPGLSSGPLRRGTGEWVPAPDTMQGQLLDVGIIIFLVGPAPGELDLMRLAVVPEMLIDELRAIVGVDAAESKGQGLAQFLQRGGGLLRVDRA